MLAWARGAEGGFVSASDRIGFHLGSRAGARGVHVGGGGSSRARRAAVPGSGAGPGSGPAVGPHGRNVRGRSVPGFADGSGGNRRILGRGGGACEVAGGVY